MFGTGLVVIIIGAAIVLVGFIYAASNMARGVAKFTKSFDNPSRGVDFDSPFGEGMFTRHFGAMIVIAVGGFVTFIGVLLSIYTLVTQAA